jgi:NADPH:quinone reductase-like Zn-dependent oxidoreductase
MSKVIRLHAFGGPENLRIEDLPSRHPAAGEVRLRVEAAGINRDHFTFMSGQQFKGHGFEQPELPLKI